jgi:hypothetical protein
MIKLRIEVRLTVEQLVIIAELLVPILSFLLS